MKEDDYLSFIHVKRFLFYFLLFCLLGAVSSFSCEQILNESITSQTQEVSSKAEKYLDLAWEYASYDPHTSKIYGDSSLYFSKLGKDSLGISKAYNVLGRSAIVETKFNLALAYFTKAWKIRKKLYKNAVSEGNEDEINSRHIDLANSHLNIGNSLRNLGRYSESLIQFESAKKIYRQNNLQTKVVKLKSSIAVTYREMEKYSQAINEHNEVIQYYRIIEDSSLLARSLVASAQTHMDFRLCEDASLLLKEASEILENSNNQTDKKSLTFEKANYNYTCLHDFDQAKNQYRNILASKETRLYPDILLLSIFNLADLYSSLEKYDSSYFFYEEYLNIIKPQQDTLDLLKAYMKMGEVTILDKDTTKALTVFEKIQKLASDNLPPYLGYQAYSYLAQLAFIKMDFQLAYKYEQQSSQYRDILSKETKKSYDLLRELDKQKVQAENQKRVDKIIQAFLGITILLLVIAFIFIIRGYTTRQKYLSEQKQNAELMQKVNEEIKKQEAQRFDALLKGQEDERSRIARTLHDSVGPSLSVLKWSLNSIEQKLPLVQVEAATKLSEVNKLVDSIMKQLRSLSHDLSGDMLIKMGIIEAIHNFTQQVQNSGQITVNVEYSGFKGQKDQLNGKIELLLFRMVQEMTGNAIKHGKAKNITIQLNKFDDLVNLMVTDDGMGFDYQKVKETKSGGIGLHGFELQVKELGGVLSVDSIPHKETTICIDIPLNNNH